jgi:tRNA (cytidine/uridine-2'-O-)-methyltransferase
MNANKATMPLPILNVILHRPIIPWNTGNIGRTCLGMSAALHLIDPGFDIGDKATKRAGLDYWKDVNLHVYKDWKHFEETAVPLLKSNVFMFSKLGKHGEKPLEATNFFESQRHLKTDDKILGLLFGSEHTGLDGICPIAIETYDRVFLPMNGENIRSYNLSSSVAMGMFEAHRQFQSTP